MSNAIIRAELEGKLKTWALAQSVPVAWENIGFEKPSDGSHFVECFILPNETMNREVSGSRKTYLGLFQINCWAKKGTGMGEVQSLAQQLVDLFPLVPKSGLVSIEGTPSAGRPIEDEAGWVIVPVLIKYRYEAV